MSAQLGSDVRTRLRSGAAVGTVANVEKRKSSLYSKNLRWIIVAQASSIFTLVTARGLVDCSLKLVGSKTQVPVLIPLFECYVRTVDLWAKFPIRAIFLCAFRMPCSQEGCFLEARNVNMIYS